MQSLSIYTAPELSNADTGVPIVTLDENLSNIITRALIPAPGCITTFKIIVIIVQ